MASNYDHDEDDDEVHHYLDPAGRASVRRALNDPEDEETDPNQPKPSLLDIFRAKFMNG